MARSFSCGGVRRVAGELRSPYNDRDLGVDNDRYFVKREYRDRYLEDAWMAHPQGKKEESRSRILASAGRGFRARGFSGLGVDGLAKAAGVTSGAFYAHFDSKAEAFRETVRVGMADLASGIDGFRKQGGPWLASFIDFYLGERGHAPLEASCALQSLNADVARSDANTRRVFAEAFVAIAADLGTDLPSDAQADGWQRGVALLALLAGGVSLARAVDDQAEAERVLAAVRTQARQLAGVGPSN